MKKPTKVSIAAALLSVAFIFAVVMTIINMARNDTAMPIGKSMPISATFEANLQSIDSSETITLPQRAEVTSEVTQPKVIVDAAENSLAELHQCEKEITQLKQQLSDAYSLLGNFPNAWFYSDYALTLPEEDRMLIVRGLRKALPIFPSIWQAQQVLSIMQDTQHMDHEGVCSYSCLDLHNFQIHRLIDVIGLDEWLKVAAKNPSFSGTVRTKSVTSLTNWYVDETFWQSEFGVALPKQFQ
jgi:hypothetical protein